jgi:hypothetical protein
MRRELVVAKQVNLILATWSGAELARRPAAVPGKLLDRIDAGPYGVRGVVATLKSMQHHLV